jgi:hypothetical protein
MPLPLLVTALGMALCQRAGGPDANALTALESLAGVCFLLPIAPWVALAAWPLFGRLARRALDAPGLIVVGTTLAMPAASFVLGRMLSLSVLGS